MPAQLLRQEQINTHSVVLRALGAVGNALLEYHPEDWRQRLAALKLVDWRKAVGGRSTRSGTMCALSPGPSCLIAKHALRPRLC